MGLPFVRVCPYHLLSSVILLKLTRPLLLAIFAPGGLIGEIVGHVLRMLDNGREKLSLCEFHKNILNFLFVFFWPTIVKKCNRIRRLQLQYFLTSTRIQNENGGICIEPVIAMNAYGIRCVMVNLCLYSIIMFCMKIGKCIFSH